MLENTDFEYQYPDSSDQIIRSFINQTEIVVGSWENLEAEVIVNICAKISANIKSILDVGCGTGRLIEFYFQLFNPDLYVGIDADFIRVQQAKERFINPRVLLYRENILTFKYPQNFDLVICSHLIEHMRTDHLEQTINKINSVIKPNGYLILSLPFNRNLQNDKYYFSYLSEGVLLKEEITKFEYDESLTNRNNKLPLIVFSEKTISTLMKNSSFEIVEEVEYHVIQRNVNVKNYNYDLMLLCRV